MPAILFSAALCILISNKIYSQEYDFQTHTYQINDSSKLELDLFLPDSAGSDLPFLLFIYGGGFSGGKRKNGHHYCPQIAP